MGYTKGRRVLLFAFYTCSEEDFRNGSILKFVQIQSFSRPVEVVRVMMYGILMGLSVSDCGLEGLQEVEFM